MNWPSRWNHVSIVKALKDEAEGGAGGFAGQSWDPGLEIEVPFEQRPVSMSYLNHIRSKNSFWIFVSRVAIIKHKMIEFFF